MLKNIIKSIINRFNNKLKNISIDYPKKTQISNNVFIGKNTVIRSRGGVTIGKNTVIACNVTILSANHDYNHGLPFSDDYILKPVIVGDNVWIGTGVIILPGITIGSNVVIGAGTIVNNNIPDNYIICNETKIKIIGTRESKNNG
ncbi:Putative acetyltransferase DDB_G0280825 [Planktothrix tepida]|uniref:Putative Galactoside O-acetyltransferase n=1 Tax=Planktothrix tepida PCC 9214 TaxID=671072 RepID=A0A1J1LI33_9CYAN|nr:DapH/DapD/GlmU-related protein [Planktothrix tepida]CAD5984814.1 Putative acetyltransferase DDB_G0280825 [Planktothrix tepida]CAD5985099.1 Putative acetyltransferase DDB_G0280825 [Planktothrix tepida]CUR32147.1 putative Galactoside O-acetyltransferase [Planktothrix tepida PCC 9214]